MNAATIVLYFNELMIKPVIKVRKNSSTNANGCIIPRKLVVVVEQLENVKRWNKKHGYGMRWIAESAFSSIKRTFGEYVMSLKWENRINELFLKASLYNNMFIGKWSITRQRSIGYYFQSYLFYTSKNSHNYKVFSERKTLIQVAIEVHLE
jgi:hypothetical protein